MAKETIGEYLKRERELRQITLEEMVEGTKIALQRLRELENDRLEDMPAEIFVRGFIRSYAEFIGLNPDEVILRYEEELKALQEKEAAEAGTVYHCPETKSYRDFIGIIVAAVIFFALAAGGYWLFLKSGISIPDMFSKVKDQASELKIELTGDKPETREQSPSLVNSTSVSGSPEGVTDSNAHDPDRPDSTISGADVPDATAPQGDSNGQVQSATPSDDLQNPGTE